MIMKTLMVLLASATILVCISGCGIATFPQAESEDRVEKSFAVSSGGQLTVNADRGSIEVAATDGETVKVEVTREARAASEAEAKEMLQDHELTFNHQGDKVEITAKYKDGRRLWDGFRHRLQVHFQISVPRKYNIDLKTAGGAITVSDLAGKVKIETGGGDLKIGHIQGPVWARTAGGRVALGGATEAADLMTSGGSIAVDDVGGVINAHTSGGSISVRFATQLKGDCSLHTSGGSIHADLAEKIAVELDAQTSGGRVVSDLPVTMTLNGEQRSSHLHGKINGGGPVLVLKTGGGNIHLHKF
jgi:hypothetical protein